MLKKFLQWLVMRKVKNAAGDLEAQGFSVTKLCVVAIGLMQAIEYASPYFGHPLNIDPKIYGGIASIGGIALKEGVDRSAK